jgi:hypothetical protein
VTDHFASSVVQRPCRGASEERGRSEGEHQGVVSRFGRDEPPMPRRSPMGPAKAGRVQLALSPAWWVMAPFERTSFQSGEPLAGRAWGSP